MVTFKRFCGSLFLIAVATSALRAHDMFSRLTSYFVKPGAALRIPVLNGTFSTSENSIRWERVRAGSSGTYVVGLSTKPREFELAATAFNKYLADDGIPDVLATRKKDGSLNRPAKERYHKHIKSIFQVGDTRSAEWNSVLGYPAELVPLENPYGAKVGVRLGFRCLVEGKPIPNQYVQFGGRSGSRGDQRLAAGAARADKNGVVWVTINRPGRWYVKFTHMARVDDGTVNYESKWASLTFEER